MTRRLYIHAWGAVTPVGLCAPTTCAAIRARISRLQEIDAPLPPEAPQIGARVAAGAGLRRTPGTWLVNLAFKAIAESLALWRVHPARTALLLAPPEPFRHHPGMLELPGRRLLDALEQRLGVRFHPRSALVEGGAAGTFQALADAERLLADPTLEQVIVGGVDSLVNDTDLERLRRAGRLYRPDNPQGVMPAEGSSVLMISGQPRGHVHRPLGQIIGVGVATEAQTVLGSEHSSGQAMCRALRAATPEQWGEASIAFVSSTLNGERYAAWEAMIHRARFYKTRRERLPLILPAMSVGDLGAAAGALSIIVAATAIGRGYAPGSIAMCEASADEGLRGACMVAPGH